MEERIITFTANEQGLVKTGGISHYASDTISYIKAVFTLGENWQGFDEVRAVFKSPYECRPAVLDSNGECYVPVEVLFYKGKVKVNLVGSIVTETEVTDRLTTYSVEALDVDEDVPICGEESQPISPSEYEQFVAKVANDANRAEQSATDAKTYADEAEASAQNASESASASAVSASDSARSATASAESAQNASEIAVEVEVMKNEVELAKDKVLGMRATAETLEAGSDATASYSDGLLTLGIPRGDRGEQGIQGETGATPNLTIGTVETLEPTEDATATITGTAENPVLNLGIPQGEVGEVSYADLKTLLPMDTASGSIVSISDGQSVIPVESLKVSLEPIQDLHGYDKPWSGGNGKNLYSDVFSEYTKPGSYYIKPIPLEIGQTVKCTVTLKGTAMTGCVVAIVGSGDTYPFGSMISFVNTSGNILNQSSFSIGETWTSPKLAIYCSGEEQFNQIFANYQIQLEKGSDSTSYEPYSNICPISGHTECVTSVSGVNVWDEEWERGYYKSDGTKDSSNGNICCTNRISVLPSTTYYIKTPYANGLRIYELNSDGAVVADDAYKNNIALTTKSQTRYIVFYTNASDEVTTYSGGVSINYPSTDHDYHAYDGNTYTTTLGRTVYGGTLDVVSGELVVDRAMVDMGTLNWSYYSSVFYVNLTDKISTLPSASDIRIMCSKYAVVPRQSGMSPSEDGVIYEYAGGNPPYLRICVRDDSFNGNVANFKTASSGQTICYELATPQTIQLTPQEVRLLLGTNNVWSDGDVTMTYNADIQRYIDKKLSGNSTTSMLSMSRPMVQTTETEETETETAETE